MNTVNTVLECITPQVALEYLKRNVRNRKPRRRVIESLAREILRGEYVTTHQGIAFDEDGNLIDGQQRLYAIVLANKPVNILVTRALPREAIKVIDRGETRSIKDVMDIVLEPNDPRSKYLANKRIISSISQLVNYGYKRMRVTPNDTQRVFEEIKDYLEAVHRIFFCQTRGKGVRSVVVAAAIAAMINGVPTSVIEAFFNIYFRRDISGCDDYGVNAALLWVDCINNAKIQGYTLDGRRLYLNTQNCIYHFANNNAMKKLAPIERPRYDVSSLLSSALSKDGDSSDEVRSSVVSPVVA